MLIFTNERCQRQSRKARRNALPFQPGELYMVRYMATPTVVTVLSVKDGMVTTWTATETFEQFNSRILCRLGVRSSILGFFLPWAHVSPSRHIHLDVEDSLGTDDGFWKVKQA